MFIFFIQVKLYSGTQNEVFKMKWIIVLLVIAAGVWAYFNIDFTGMKENAQEDAMNAIKNEKTIKVFFEADKQNKEETQQTIKEHF